MAVLGAMIYDAQATTCGLTLLKPEHFYTKDHGTIFKAIQKAYREHNRVDAVLVKDALGAELDAVGGAAYLITLTEQFPVATGAESYAKIVKERYHQRQIASAAQNLTKRAVSLAGTDELVAACAEVNRAIAGAVATPEETTASVVERAFAGVEERSRLGKPEFSWGISKVDEAMGGLRRREVYVVAAKTSHLKTGIALTVARANAKGEARIGYWCCENLEQIPLRLAALHSMLPLDWFLKPYSLNEDQRRLMRASRGDLDPILKHIEIFGLERAAQVSARLSTERFDLVIVDYLQRMAEVVNVKERHVAASSTFHALYRLATQYNCVVIVLSQVTIPDDFRGKHKAPTLENLRESGDISQFADSVVIGYWKWRDTLDDQDNPQKYEITVAKSKMGRCGKVPVAIDPSSLRFVG